MTDTVLKESFGDAGKEFGYEDVDAEFAAFKEFKIKWQRSRGKADFRVSDYLSDASPDVLGGIARTLFSRICGNETDYPDEMTKWITSDDFVRTKQPTYIRRSKNLSRTPEGKYRDLEASRRRLRDAGLIRDEKDVFVSWTKDPNIRRVGYCSVLMKVIAISSVFDTEMIPEFVLDFVVYHEYLHIMQGFKPFGRKHGKEFTAEERKYPMRNEAEQWLKKLKLYL